MDSTVFTLFLILGAGFVWLVMFIIKANRSVVSVAKPKSVKDELFGKNRKKRSKETWSISD